ncbi:type II toxin-antitoxin system HicB family antitoxin [Paenarthrobacter sp. NPDC090522]|uniref:type II toxin-antitoxin system HicB family antitoxin n=1 Tax=Paenarthrobacter sp. NPDC090522 TaxID=3364383 RepID=UPI003803FFA9
MDITAQCHRGGKWWVIEVPEIDGLHTQARKLSEVKAMVLDAASALTGRPEGDFYVRIFRRGPKPPTGPVSG